MRQGLKVLDRRSKVFYGVGLRRLLENMVLLEWFVNHYLAER